MVATDARAHLPMTFHFPIYRGGAYSGWQVDLAFRILGSLGPKDLPLDSPAPVEAEALAQPLLRWLRDDGDLDGVATFREYRMDWPERLCLDCGARRRAPRRDRAQLHHRAPGPARGGRRVAGRASPTPRHPSGGRASARSWSSTWRASWIDRVNEAAAKSPRRNITGTKGAHVMIRLPAECATSGSRPSIDSTKAVLSACRGAACTISARRRRSTKATSTTSVRPRRRSRSSIGEAQHLLPGARPEAARRDCSPGPASGR